MDILERQKSDLQHEVELLKQRYYSSLQPSVSVAAPAPAPGFVPTAGAPQSDVAQPAAGPLRGGTAMSSRVRFDIDGRVVSTQGGSNSNSPGSATTAAASASGQNSVQAFSATTWPPTASNATTSSAGSSNSSSGVVYPSVLSSSATDINDILSALSGSGSGTASAGKSSGQVHSFADNNRDRFSSINDSLSSTASGGSSSTSENDTTSTERRLREMLASAMNPNRR